MPSWPSSSPLPLGFLYVPTSSSDPPSEVPDDINGYVPMQWDPITQSLWWYDTAGDVWNELEAGGGSGGWLFGTIEAGPYERPPASATLLGVTFLAWDLDGGTPYACNGMSWVQTAPGVSAAPMRHGDEAHDTPAVPPVTEDELTNFLTVSSTVDGPPPIAPRPEASTALMRHFHLLLEHDEGAALQYCNGASWVDVAYLNPHPRTHGSEAHVAVPVVIGQEIIKVKPFDQQLANQINAINDGVGTNPDTGLWFDMLAGEKWWFSVDCFYEGDTAASNIGDIRVGFSAPTGAAGRWGFTSGADSSSTGQTGGTYSPRQGSSTDFSPATTMLPFSLATIGIGTVMFVSLRGYVSNPTTAGRLQFRWSQRAASAVSTTVKFYSSITGKKVG